MWLHKYTVLLLTDAICIEKKRKQKLKLKSKGALNVGAATVSDLETPAWFGTNLYTNTERVYEIWCSGNNVVELDKRQSIVAIQISFG